MTLSPTIGLSKDSSGRVILKGKPEEVAAWWMALVKGLPVLGADGFTVIFPFGLILPAAQGGSWYRTAEAYGGVRAFRSWEQMHEDIGLLWAREENS